MIKIILRAISVLFSAGIVTLLLFCVIYTPEYVYRCLLSGVLGMDIDLGHSRTISAISKPYRFSLGSLAEEAEVKKLFESIFQTNNLDAYLASIKTGAFIVVQNDKLLYEHYFNGYERTSLFPSHSVTKSFVSALIGIAISEGKIHSVSDPVTRYIPELASWDARFTQITIRNLLMMSSGIRFDQYFFFTADSSLSGTYPDLRYAAIHFPRLIAEPGRDFMYNDWNPQLLGIILERATGTNVSDYLEEFIWQQIGMEYDASWTLDSQQPGFEKMQGGLSARAIDFAKFGCLYLHKGAWGGQRILPESWVVESTQEATPVIDGIPEGLFYKYLWWGIRRENGGSDYYAMGNYGQMIFVSPANGLVIVRLGGGEARSEGLSKWYTAAREFSERFRQVD